MTTYAHIPIDLNISKLHLRLVKVQYYECKAYKLLDHTMGSIFKFRDIIFEEEHTNYVK